MAISLLLNDFDEVTFAIVFQNVEGILHELFIKDRCSTKKELNISAFSSEFVIYLLYNYYILLR